MRVAVVGAGAIGGLIAGACARAGAEVRLVARGAHLHELARTGLRIRSRGQPEERFALPASDDPRAFPVQDVVFLGTKAHGIGVVLPLIAPLVGPETVVVPAINGIPWWYFARHPRYPQGGRIECLDRDGTLAAGLDARRIVGCVVHAAGEVVEPGVVALTTPGNVYILGEPDGEATPRLARIAAMLRAGGAKVTETPQIRNAVWTKLIGNLSYNPVAALTLANMSEVNANDALVGLIRVVMAEAMRVAEHYGERITMTIDERIAISRSLGASRVSMHQDLERGRPLEVAAIVSSVLELARKAAIAVPMIETVHALIEERARHVRAPDG